jgi:hypothetical protein
MRIKTMTKIVFSIARRAKRATLSLTIAAVALLLCSAVALAEVRVGSDSDYTLVGTHSADLINGKEDGDTLEGLAGNDTCHFANGFG